MFEIYNVLNAIYRIHTNPPIANLVFDDCINYI